MLGLVQVMRVFKVYPPWKQFFKNEISKLNHECRATWEQANVTFYTEYTVCVWNPTITFSWQAEMLRRLAGLTGCPWVQRCSTAVHTRTETGPYFALRNGTIVEAQMTRG
jgi:hypothetical protein